MGTATVLLVIVWLAIAAGVMIWALRARHAHHDAPAADIDLTEPRVERLPEARNGERGGPAHPAA